MNTQIAGFLKNISDMISFICYIQVSLFSPDFKMVEEERNCIPGKPEARSKHRIVNAQACKLTLVVKSLTSHWILSVSASVSCQRIDLHEEVPTCWQGLTSFGQPDTARL